MEISRTYTTLLKIQEALRAGGLTYTELVRNYLNNIEKHRHLNAYVEIFADEALKKAEDLDLKHSQSQPVGKLAGAVISIKDVLCYQGHQVTASSKILQGFESLFTATAIQKLLDADAIIIGRVGCDEFAMGSDNRTSYYGPIKNGKFPDRVPGGSSGGSAVSVQSNTCLVSIGSDTGGSVRQPASFCELTGFKPTYGRISRHGLLAYASSFDQIGVIGRDIGDVKCVYEVMTGVDTFDSTAVRVPLEDSGSPVKPPFKIAYIKEVIEHDSLQPAIRHAFMQKIEHLQKQGWEVESLSFPLLDYVIPAYYILTSAEASSNLSRYDGVRYGFRSQDASSLMNTYTQTRTQGFGIEVKRRILLGTFVLSVGYYDAYFGKAQKVRRLIKEQFDAWFTRYDGLLVPTTPSTAWKFNEKQDPLEIYLADIYSVLANLAGLPALSIPLGLDEKDLPFGLQILSGRFREEAIFTMAKSMKLD